MARTPVRTGHSLWCLALAATALSAACAPTVAVVPRGPMPMVPLPDTTIVNVLATDTPRCPYREVAELTAQAGRIFSFQDIKHAMQVRAREIGANGVIRLTTFVSSARVVNGKPTGEVMNLHGIAVLFTQAGCAI